MNTSLNRVFSKMPKQKVELSNRKVELSTMDDYNDAKEIFYSLNNEVGDIFSELEKLKSRFESIDDDWLKSNAHAQDINSSLFDSMSDLGLDDRATDFFMEGLDLTNDFSGPNRVFTTEGLTFLRS